MKFGFVLPQGDARAAAQFAEQAEQAGWDGFFVWEPVWGVDAWVSLTAAAMRTRRIRLGTLLSPISRMRPWKLASETAALDNLSNGRVVLSVGLGAVDTGFAAFGEETDRKIRAELLDEGLEILTGLWRGQPFNYAGRHYRVKETAFMPPPPPVQQPRIPIWVVGLWPSETSMARAVRYDGILPAVRDPEGRWRDLQPADIVEIRDYLGNAGVDLNSFDIVVEGVTPGADPDAAAKRIRPWQQAGATWWIEAMWGDSAGTDILEAVRERLIQGPPPAG